jgi:hypothetical protein
LGDLLGGGARTGEEVGVDGPLKDARRPAIREEEEGVRAHVHIGHLPLSRAALMSTRTRFSLATASDLREWGL